MEGVGILDGDIAVLDSMKEVKDGAIAAILIEDEATLKHVYRRPEGLLLKAENPMFRDIEFPPPPLSERGFWVRWSGLLGRSDPCQTLTPPRRSVA